MITHLRPLALAATLVLNGSCATTTWLQDFQRGPINSIGQDFGCNDLKATALNDAANGSTLFSDGRPRVEVTGCGKRATYFKSDKGAGWLLDKEDPANAWLQ